MKNISIILLVLGSFLLAGSASATLFDFSAMVEDLGTEDAPIATALLLADTDTPLVQAVVYERSVVRASCNAAYDYWFQVNACVDAICEAYGCIG